MGTPILGRAIVFGRSYSLCAKVWRLARRLLHLPLKRGGRRAPARRVGIAFGAERLIPTRLGRLKAGLGDLPFSR
jgi:hypothetical protein